MLGGAAEMVWNIDSVVLINISWCVCWAGKLCLLIYKAMICDSHTSSNRWAGRGRSLMG